MVSPERLVTQSLQFVLPHTDVYGSSALPFFNIGLKESGTRTSSQECFVNGGLGMARSDCVFLYHRATPREA